MKKFSAKDICELENRSAEPEFVRLSDFDDYAQGCQNEIAIDRKLILDLEEKLEHYTEGEKAHHELYKEKLLRIEELEGERNASDAISKFNDA